MHRGARVLGALTLLLTIWGGLCPAQVDDGRKERIFSVVEDALKQRTLHSGTLDILDPEGEKVRNLRLLEKSTDISEEGGAYFLVFDYRDINDGDIVKVEFKLTGEDEAITLEGIGIKEVRKLAKAETVEGKEYSGEEVQGFMRGYIEKQTQFTDGKLMLFDEEHQKLRNLELKELKPEIRRMGVFYSSSAQFVDAESGEKLDIDISVENSKGKLNIQALRIRGVQNGS